MPATARRYLTLSLLALAPAVAAAQFPVGHEFQVNTNTTNLQWFSSASSDGAAGFVVSWNSYGSCGTCYNIQAQRYAADGTPAGAEFQVNTEPLSTNVARPSVSPDGSGGFVVAWHSFSSSGTDTDPPSVQARRYEANGTPAGDQFQVNTYTTGDQRAPVVSSDGGAGFVITWRSTGSSGSDSSGSSVQAQRYSADGTPSGSEFQVNTYTTSDQNSASVSPDGAAGFVVAWESNGSSGTDTDFGSIQGQRYAADGTPSGTEFQVNTYTTSDQYFPAVSLDGAGGFVVTWSSDGSGGTDTSGPSVQARRYEADGIPLGDQFQVNTYTTGPTGLQYNPAVSADGDAGFVVSWTSGGSSGTDTSNTSIQGQRYSPDGAPVGGQFQLNTYTTSAQVFPTVSPDGGGRLVVSWTSNGSSGTDTSAFSIQAQRIAGPGIFADGFESGDTSAWSTVVP